MTFLIFSIFDTNSEKVFDKILLSKFLVNFSNDFFSFCIDLTPSKILDFEEVNCPIFDNSIEFFLRNSTALYPEIASILLIPEATEPSDKILNTLSERVFLTCVPPHNSYESPNLMDLTLSPYFSPNKATTPFLIALS